MKMKMKRYEYEYEISDVVDLILIQTEESSRTETEFLSDCCAIPPTPGIATFVAFDRLSRAPPLF